MDLGVLSRAGQRCLGHLLLMDKDECLKMIKYSIEVEREDLLELFWKRYNQLKDTQTGEFKIKERE